MKTRVLRFKHEKRVKRENGEIARLKVVKGPDFGVVFTVLYPKVSIGRGEMSDVMISDLKASRQHCELRNENGIWTVVDLGSSNGIIIDGMSQRNAMIQTGGKFQIGETTFEFVSSDSGTQALESAPVAVVEKSAREVEENQRRIRAITQMGSGGVPQVEMGGGPEKKKVNPVVLLLVAGAAAMMFIEEEPVKRQQADEGADDPDRVPAVFFASSGEPVEDSATRRTARVNYRLGLREYIAGNYLRAKRYFDIVLDVEPDNKLAKLYKSNATQAIEKQVKQHLKRGKKTFFSGKLKEARGHYEAVLRLLHFDPNNEDYAEAKGQLAKVKKEIERNSI